MKVIKLIFILVVLSMITLIAKSQEKQTKTTKKTEKVEIQTSAQCSMCKDRMEKELAFEKGVKSVNLDLETKIITIEYRTDKTYPTKLKEAISKIGYDADNVLADIKAYDKLPDCCKKGGHD